MTDRVLVDGRSGGKIAASDRGLAFGDGVFRTLAVRGGRPLNWDRHFRLLAHDCASIGIACPAQAVLRAEIGQVAPGDATVKMTVTRGVSGRGYSLPVDCVPTRIVASFPPPEYPPELAREGVRVRRCALVLSEQPRLAGVKTLCRLENVLARAEWFDPAIREGLLADAQGRLVEGTMSNVFIVKKGAIVTPSLARCGVAGAQRERVLDFARRQGHRPEIRDVTFAELAGADEAFLTNSLIGLWPIASFEGRSWVPGPVTRSLQRLVEADDAREA
jgi:4-amino-4-deoxychorismate lyase